MVVASVVFTGFCMAVIRLWVLVTNAKSAQGLPDMASTLGLLLNAGARSAPESQTSGSDLARAAYYGYLVVDGRLSRTNFNCFLDAFGDARSFLTNTQFQVHTSQFFVSATLPKL